MKINNQNIHHTKLSLEQMASFNSTSLWSQCCSSILCVVVLNSTVELTTFIYQFSCWWRLAATAAAKSLQLCPTLCDPIVGSLPGFPVPGILQARTLEWVAISFSNAWKWKVKGKLLSCVWLLATPWTVAHQTSPSMGFSRQEYWSGVPLPSPHNPVLKRKGWALGGISNHPTLITARSPASSPLGHPISPNPLVGSSCPWLTCQVKPRKHTCM